VARVQVVHQVQILQAIEQCDDRFDRIRFGFFRTGLPVYVALKVTLFRDCPLCPILAIAILQYIAPLAVGIPVAVQDCQSSADYG
jgi:hypothetical protein